MRLFTRHPPDSELVAGILAGGPQRRQFENRLFEKFNYLIADGARKHQLGHEECFNAYSDAILSTIDNIAANRFEEKSALKTYIYQIFTNKCVDLIRKKTTNRQSVHNAVSIDDSLLQLPDGSRSMIQELINQQDIILLRQRLNGLGAKCRDMLLAWGEGYSDAEIAETLQYNSAAVAKTSRIRCLERLREIYQKRSSTNHEL